MAHVVARFAEKRWACSFFWPTLYIWQNCPTITVRLPRRRERNQSRLESERSEPPALMQSSTCEEIRTVNAAYSTAKDGGASNSTRKGGKRRRRRWWRQNCGFSDAATASSRRNAVDAIISLVRRGPSGSQQIHTEGRREGRNWRSDISHVPNGIPPVILFSRLSGHSAYRWRRGSHHGVKPDVVASTKLRLHAEFAWGRGTTFPPLLLPCPFTSSSFAVYYFFPFSFSHSLYLFSSIVHPISFYQNRPTTFPGVRS